MHLSHSSKNLHLSVLHFSTNSSAHSLCPRTLVVINTNITIQYIRLYDLPSSIVYSLTMQREESGRVVELGCERFWGLTGYVSQLQRNKLCVHCYRVFEQKQSKDLEESVSWWFAKMFQPSTWRWFLIQRLLGTQNKRWYKYDRIIAGGHRWYVAIMT